MEAYDWLYCIEKSSGMEDILRLAELDPSYPLTLASRTLSNKFCVNSNATKTVEWGSSPAEAVVRKQSDRLVSSSALQYRELLGSRWHIAVDGVMLTRMQAAGTGESRRAPEIVGARLRDNMAQYRWLVKAKWNTSYHWWRAELLRERKDCLQSDKVTEQSNTPVRG
jgi:hypothetical protein